MAKQSVSTFDYDRARAIAFDWTRGAGKDAGPAPQGGGIAHVQSNGHPRVTTLVFLEIVAADDREQRASSY